MVSKKAIASFCRTLSVFVPFLYGMGGAVLHAANDPAIACKGAFDRLRDGVPWLPAHAEDVALAVGAGLRGNPHLILRTLGSVEGATPGTLTFLGNPHFRSHLPNLVGVAVLLHPDHVDPALQKIVQIPVEDPTAKFAELALPYASSLHSAGLDILRQKMRSTFKDLPPLIDPKASVSPQAEIGKGTVIEAHATIGPNVTIGQNCHIHSGARIRGNTLIGDNVDIYSNAVIGEGGFGYFQDRDGRVHAFPQTGRVVIEHDALIGAGSVIDAAALGDTVIGAGTQTDSLVKIGHGVKTGDGAFIGAYAAIGGSTHVGKGVVIGPYAAISNGIDIGDGAKIGARSGVVGDVPPNGDYLGFPARPKNQELRRIAQESRDLKRVESAVEAPAVVESETIKLFDPSRQSPELKNEIDENVLRVLHSGNHILGPEVERLEKELARVTGYKHAVGVSNGTDAIILSLKALGLEPGDEVVVPAFTFVATGNAVAYVGFKPRFADVDSRTANLSVETLNKAITKDTKAVVVVDLFGKQSPIKELREFCDQHGIYLVEDGAQSLGVPNSGAHIYTTSFYPTKNLGAAGDGGAVFTDSNWLAERVKKLTRHGGMVRNKYDMVGTTARLDEMQAAVLNVKLPHLREWISEKRGIAHRYRRELAELEKQGKIVLPPAGDPATESFGLFTIQVPGDRAALADFLKERGILTGVYYPYILPDQPKLNVFASTAYPNGSQLSEQVLSLPIYPGLSSTEVDRVIQGVKDAFLQEAELKK